MLKVQTRLINSYYIATPIFMLLDLLFGLNFRVAAFNDQSFWKYTYYTFCFCCLVIILWKPLLSTFVALIESSINILILTAGLLLPLLDMASYIEYPETTSPPITFGKVINYILAGSVCLNSFYQGAFKISDRELL